MVQGDPYLGVQTTAGPGFQNSLKAAAAAPVRLTAGHVVIEKGAAIRGDGMDGTAVRAGQEDAGPAGLSSGDQRADAEDPSILHDLRAGRGQQVLARPNEQVFAGSQVLMNPVEVGRDQVTWQVVAVQRAVPTRTHGSREAELGARGINQGQSMWRHGDGLSERDQVREDEGGQENTLSAGVAPGSNIVQQEWAEVMGGGCREQPRGWNSERGKTRTATCSRSERSPTCRRVRLGYGVST